MTTALPPEDLDLMPSTVQELIEFGAALADPDEVTETGPVAAVYTVPNGYHSVTVDLEEIRAPYRDGPRRKAGRYTTTDVASFLTYYAKHADEAAEIWVADSTVTAVLDAHPDGNTAWEEHQLVLVLRHSPEWARWFAVSGKLLSQVQFAEFLEEAAADVVTPDMATMLEVASSLQAATKVDFKSAYRTADGQRAFKYEETTTAKAGQKGELEIPDRLGLRLRVFLGQDPVDVYARFRYRLTDNGLALGVVLDRVAEVLEEARDAVVVQITDGTDRGIVLRGSTAP